MRAAADGSRVRTPGQKLPERFWQEPMNLILPAPTERCPKLAQHLRLIESRERLTNEFVTRRMGKQDHWLAHETHESLFVAALCERPRLLQFSFVSCV